MNVTNLNQGTIFEIILNMKRDLTKYISKGSILTSLTVLLQTSPVFYLL